jgi:hypothetical protein
MEPEAEGRARWDLTKWPAVTGAMKADEMVANSREDRAEDVSDTATEWGLEFIEGTAMVRLRGRGTRLLDRFRALGARGRT